MTKADPPIDRRSRRKAQVRQRLLASARQLIADGGVTGLRIGDVTALADVGFGTFYNHFESKDELIKAVVTEALRTLADSVGSAALEADDPAVAAAESYRRFLLFASDEPEIARVLVALDRHGDAFETAVRPWADRLLQRGCTTGRFDIADRELCLISIASSALSAISAILAGRIPAGEHTAAPGVEMMLRAFGVDFDSARDIAYQH
ncbi:TetR/AcrR family transcriptional regulator [Mycolicibacterium neoaurum]|uniref:TetR/AcrR family transcriptional regulator n=1 Tax=Mycolicibacterium neoaurum TaxID=1795 RepID=UPI00248AA8E5|nr:TetR/AcrR family transcriptional regulator [Mycolicibacterium neoaurum]WBP95838.1 TetR/AcrR family transcriptional regulator [Mycolicibacterium neoaurum]WBS09523.1 TetR/AcrR family transcriptional regulator [Mycolicibacterium neoaurum]